MKKLITGFICILVFTSLRAQEFGLNFYAGLNAGYVSFEDFNKFRKSYFNVNKVELKPFTFSRGYNYTGEMEMVGIIMNYTFEKATARTSANLEFGDKRVFQLVNRNFGCEFGYAIGEDDKLRVVPYFGIFMASSVLNSFYLLRDGYEDYGNSKTLNGSYQTLAFSIPLGVKVYVPLVKPLFVMMGFNVNPIFTSLTYENWMDGAPLQEIPVDYEAYQAGGQYEGAYLKPKMTTFNLKLGLGVHIGQ